MRKQSHQRERWQRQERRLLALPPHLRNYILTLAVGSQFDGIGRGSPLHHGGCPSMCRRMHLCILKVQLDGLWLITAQLSGGGRWPGRVQEQCWRTLYVSGVSLRSRIKAGASRVGLYSSFPSQLAGLAPHNCRIASAALDKESSLPHSIDQCALLLPGG